MQKRLWIYDPDLEQVTIRSLDRATGDAPALLLSHNNITLEKDFSVRESNQKTQISAGFPSLAKKIMIVLLQVCKWDLPTIKLKKCVYKII